MSSFLACARCCKALLLWAAYCFVFNYHLGCSTQTAPRSPLKAVPTPPEQQIEIPYRVFGKTYYPLKSIKNFSQEGVASWYGPKFHGLKTSNNEVYDMNAMTAAHKTLPFNSRVKVINLVNGKKAVVRINDRGPFVGNRIIDLSREAARRLGVIKKGTAWVRLVSLDNPNNVFRSGNTVASQKDFSVQIGVFKDHNNANQLEQEVLNSRIESRAQGGGQYFRVLVGHFTNFDEAIKHMDELRSQGYHRAFVIANQ